MGISVQQALDCIASDDLIGIGMEADAVRRSLHPERVVTYTIEAVAPYIEDLSTLYAGIEDAVADGATGLFLSNCPTGSLARIEELLRQLKARFPELPLHSFSATEIYAVASASGLPVSEILKCLKAAGLDALSGGGADLSNPSSWIDVHRAAHHAGVPSTGSMTFGAGESSPERIMFLEAIYKLQQETCGFLAFTLISAHSPSGRDLDDPTAIEYLKTLSICRMVLDNIPHLHSDWQQQGLKVLQMGLRFGGNDIGSIIGPHTRAPEEEVRRVIRDAGFRPVQRDTLYRTVFLN